MTDPERHRRSRAESYDQTITALLTKRSDLFAEASKLRDRIAEIKNDVSALDRVLGTLGYEGDLDAAMPRQKREVLFGRGELTRGILDALRDANGPMTSREIAQSVLSLSGQDARDRKLMAEHTKRVSKALRSLKQGGMARGVGDGRGNLLWVLTGVQSGLVERCLR